MLRPIKFFLHGILCLGLQEELFQLRIRGTAPKGLLKKNRNNAVLKQSPGDR